MTEPKVLRAAAHALQRAFNRYYAAFLDITSRAQDRFEKRQWNLVVHDAEERIGLYHAHLDTIEDEIRGLGAGDVLGVSPASSLRLVPSARFWQRGEEEAYLRARSECRLSERKFRRVLELGRRVAGDSTARTSTAD